MQQPDGVPSLPSTSHFLRSTFYFLHSTFYVPNSTFYVLLSTFHSTYGSRLTSDPKSVASSGCATTYMVQPGAYRGYSISHVATPHRALRRWGAARGARVGSLQTHCGRGQRELRNFQEGTHILTIRSCCPFISRLDRAMAMHRPVNLCPGSCFNPGRSPPETGPPYQRHAHTRLYSNAWVPSCKVEDRACRVSGGACRVSGGGGMVNRQQQVREHNEGAASES